MEWNFHDNLLFSCKIVGARERRKKIGNAVENISFVLIITLPERERESVGAGVCVACDVNEQHFALFYLSNRMQCLDFLS